METYKVRRFVNGKEVKALTEEQKKLFALKAINAIRGKTKEKAL